MSLNPATKKWKLVGNMNFNRMVSHRAILLGNVVFIAGFTPKERYDEYSKWKGHIQSELCYFSIENDEVEKFVCKINAEVNVSGHGRQLKKKFK